MVVRDRTGRAAAKRPDREQSLVDDEVVVDSEKVKRAIETCGRSAVEASSPRTTPPTELYINRNHGAPDT